MYNYDSASDSSVEDTIEDILLHGDFDEVDALLRNETPLDILESPRWDYFVKVFLSLDMQIQNLEKQQ